MTGRTIVLTGASEGIGAAAARMLAKAGDTVIPVGLDTQSTQAIAREIGAPHHYTADFAELDQVETLARRLIGDLPKIDALVNNAGAISKGRVVTRDGFEKTFQINYLAPFLLTNLLLERLVENNATVVQTASVSAKRFGDLDPEDLQNERAFSSNKAYGDSKILLILFTKELQRRFGRDGISTVSFHPGSIQSSFGRDTDSWFRFIFRTPLRHLLETPETGARRLRWLLDGTPGVTWVEGGYYEKNELARSAPQTEDAGLARRMWDQSVVMLGTRLTSAK